MATERFRPFTLDPDEERYVEVVGRLGDCEHYAPGSSTLISVQHVEFEVLGQSLTADVELPRDPRQPRRFEKKRNN